MDIEFLDEPAAHPPGSDEDSVEGTGRDGRRWRGRWSRPALLAGGMALAALVAATAALRSNGGAGPTPPAPTPTPAASAAEVAAPMDVALAVVAARLTDPHPAGDLTRESSGPGDCRTVPMGTSTEAATVRVVRKSFPRFEVRDYGRVIDQFSGLCLAELRGRAGARQILVRIASPDANEQMRPFDAVSFHSENKGRVLTDCVEFRSGTGWDILAGSQGPLRNADARALDAIASDPQLRW